MMSSLISSCARICRFEVGGGRRLSQVCPVQPNPNPSSWRRGHTSHQAKPKPEPGPTLASLVQGSLSWLRLQPAPP